MPRFQHSVQSPSQVRADLLILPIFQGPQAGPGVKEVGAALGADLSKVYRENRLQGKIGEVLTVPTLGRIPAKTVILVGLGPQAEVGPDRIRRGAGRAGLRASRSGTVATTLAQAAGGLRETVQATVEGLLLGSYRFVTYKSSNGDSPQDRPRWRTVSFLGEREDAAEVREGIRRGQVVAESVMWARDLVNTPAGDATPEFLAQQAREMAEETGLQVKVWSEKELKAGGFGGILGVGAGSVNPPRLIEVRYEGGGSGPPIALTGKGVTFDSGGLSIKDAKGMEWMKADMSGAAAMLAALRAIALLKPKVDVIAAIPSAENLPSGSATKPGDVLHHRGGKTSEVLNTDAEGRLILADALAYLSEQKPRVIIDAATLTGACMIALGEDLWGVMGNDRQLIGDVLAAGEAVGEPGWELPLWRAYKRQIESNVADVKNIGERWGGAITAALFLAEFVGETPWCHLDVAGTAYHEKAGDFWPKGATGSPTRTVVRYVLDQADRDDQAESNGE